MRYFQLLHCLMRLTVVRLLLAVLGAHRTARLLLAKTSAMPNTLGDVGTLILWRERGEQLRAVARFLPGAQCLARAITLVWWARQQGLPVALCVGVKNSGSGVEAHAWSALGDALLDERSEITAGFTLVPFPGSTSASAC
jgi:Transglutaminase-like superfamily